ncbi:MAG TPA: alpha/beta hydrolase, partial [Macromonas sp.]|nr:alpha/beta hydrolase [Macromonas sp.]
PPLILMHGWRDHCRNWDWVAERLRSDWHVIAPDLRGHGDSAWSSDGQYTMPGFIHDLAQLVRQLDLGPVNILAHSLGGHVSLRYAGLFPQNVLRLMVIEGMEALPGSPVADHPERVVDRFLHWITEQRELAARRPKKYATLDEAFQRMHAENRHLSPQQARHLTVHGVNQNEDGTFSWKFDNYARAFPPNDLPYAELAHLWSRITCPIKLVYGKDSWATDPRGDDRFGLLQNASIEVYERAGHWVHHDRLEDFIPMAQQFLASPTTATP